MSAKRLHKIMNRDGFVVETDVDIQLNSDDRVVIAHDPAFIQPAVDPLQTFSIKLNPAQTGSVRVSADGKRVNILSFPFVVPTPSPGFQYQIQTYATWSVSGNPNSPNADPKFTVPVRFFLRNAGPGGTISESPFVDSFLRLNTSPLSTAQGQANAENQFLPIAQGDYISILDAQNLAASVIGATTPGKFDVFVNEASIVVTLKLVKLRPIVKIALPLDSHRGDQISIVAANADVKVYGPLTEDTPSQLVAAIVAGQRVEGIFTGVEDQSLSDQWQMGIVALHPNGPTGATGPDGSTVVGPQGSTGPTGPTQGPADKAFVSEFLRNDQLLAGDAPFAYETLGPRHNFSVLPTTIIADKSGTYRFDYYVNGYPTTGDPTPMEFAIFRNGVEVPQSHYGTNPTVTGNSVSIQATGLITLVGGNANIGNGDHLELRNVSGSNLMPIQLVSPNPGVALAASLSFDRFAD